MSHWHRIPHRAIAFLSMFRDRRWLITPANYRAQVVPKPWYSSKLHAFHTVSQHHLHKYTCGTAPPDMGGPSATHDCRTHVAPSLAHRGAECTMSKLVVGNIATSTLSECTLSGRSNIRTAWSVRPMAIPIILSIDNSTRTKGLSARRLIHHHIVMPC
jgi:hypothetical protein